MKIKLLLFAIAFLSITKLYGQTSDACCTNVLLTSYSEKMYVSEPVTDQQLDLILKCGIKSSSSKNMQPWKFTVIKDEPTMKEVIGDIVPGNVVIIISGIEGEDGTTPEFDCGLATQSMFIAAHGLNLGARIYSGPVDSINSNKKLFQIPSGYKAVTALRIGNIDKNIDAASAASPRKTPEEIINYKVNE
jgi:nitroreductase